MQNNNCKNQAAVTGSIITSLITQVEVPPVQVSIAHSNPDELSKLKEQLKKAKHDLKVAERLLLQEVLKNDYLYSQLEGGVLC